MPLPNWSRLRLPALSRIRVPAGSPLRMPDLSRIRVPDRPVMAVPGWMLTPQGKLGVIILVSLLGGVIGGAAVVAVTRPHTAETAHLSPVPDPVASTTSAPVKKPAHKKHTAAATSTPAATTHHREQAQPAPVSTHASSAPTRAETPSAPRPSTHPSPSPSTSPTSRPPLIPLFP